MKVEYVEPFIRAARDVLKIMMDLDTERGELRASDAFIPSKEASVIIGVTGDLSGSILYSFPKDMTLSMVEIMAGMTVDELDSFVASALAEVANIISGNALIYLSTNNYTCDLVPPQIVLGKHSSLSMATDRVLIVQLKTRIGDFEIFITLKENKPKQ